jgi:peptidoglycan L-alanyl-D-glutamate endopeptidase CwlK
MKTFEYGSGSQSKLDTCHPVLQEIAKEALHLSPYDITIVHGWRDMETQNALEEDGKSTKRFPDSRHNKTDAPNVIDPHHMSDALDFAPYVKGTIYWDDIMIFAVVAGCFFAAAKSLGYTIRWGGDWDSDGQTTDQTLLDWGHLEITWSDV